MILCVDIGNSYIKAAFMNGMTLHETFSFCTDKYITQEELTNHLSSGILNKIIDGVMYSSVVPELNDVFEQSCFSLLQCSIIKVTSSLKLNYTINHDDPSSLGTDRIVTAAASIYLYPGKDIVIADMGTALTFGVLLSEGIFDGGLITSGVMTAMTSLADKASKLFNVTLQKPPALSAHNTADSIQSGFYYGWISMIEGIVQRLRKEYSRDFSLALTGGGSNAIGSDIDCLLLDPHLSLKGLSVLYSLNN